MERPRTILLVEDDEAVRNLLNHALEMHGYQVLLAPNGERALESARSWTGEIDLVLSDVVLPDISGVEVARRLEQARPGVKVLLMSGYAQDLVAPGQAWDFIAKPFLLRNLLRRVEELVAR
ncbi:MAG: response regulator [Bryobacterales bacterium]|nr:response regulator [Bryobacterales bacterium]